MHSYVNDVLTYDIYNCFAGDLHNLKHCTSVPSSNLYENSKQLIDGSSNIEIDGTSASQSISQDSTYHGRHFERNSPMTRGSLSHPCLSETNKVGATSIFSHLFLGSQNDVTDEVGTSARCHTTLAIIT